MANNWAQFTLEQLCTLITDGKHGDCENQKNSGFYFLSVKDIVDDRIFYENARQITEQDFLETHRRTNLEPGDILFTNTGTIGRMAIVREDTKTRQSTFQKSVAILKARRDAIDPYFLYYLLKFENSRLSEFAAGTTQKNLLLKDLRSFAVHVPELPQQLALASILRAFDAKIELNRRMNETLESITHQLFTEIFPDILRARSDPDAVPLTHIVLISREALNPDVEPTEIFNHYSIPAFDKQRLPVREMGEQIKSNKFIVHADCVLLSKLNPRIPRVWLPAVTGNMRSICSTEFLVLRPRPGYSREFIYGLCSSATFQEIFVTMVTGTSGSHQRVKPEYLEKMAIPSPDLKKVERFTKLVQPLYARVAHNLQENSTLAVVRDTLLPKLISGEIRIKQAEKLIEANA